MINYIFKLIKMYFNKQGCINRRLYQSIYTFSAVPKSDFCRKFWENKQSPKIYRTTQTSQYKNTHSAVTITLHLVQNHNLTMKTLSVYWTSTNSKTYLWQGFFHRNHSATVQLSNIQTFHLDHSSKGKAKLIHQILNEQQLFKCCWGLVVQIIWFESVSAVYDLCATD